MAKRRHKTRLGLPAEQHSFNAQMDYLNAKFYGEMAAEDAAKGLCNKAVRKFSVASKMLGQADAHSGSTERSEFVAEREDALDVLQDAENKIRRLCLRK